MSGALSGIRVLEMTQVMAGPFCGQVLADLGADVVKVEPPGGESTRRSFGFPLHGDDSAAFLAVNRNKRSIVLDLKQAQDQRAFHSLVRTADVVLENYRPGTTAALAADWETLREVNPRLVYASISGFGQTGPYADRPGYDLIAQGLAGIMSVTGEPGGEPVKCGVPIADLSAGLFCAVGILAALRERETSGRGQRIDTSLFEAALALSIWETTELWATGRTPQRLGSAHRLSAPYQALRTRDGHITVGGNTQRLWEKFCLAIDRSDLIDDQRFAENQARMSNVDALTVELEATLCERPSKEWIDIFVQAGVPAGPIYDYKQALDDPQTLAREMKLEVEHPVEGTMSLLGIPVKLSATPGTIRRAAPLLGEHTDEILREAGVSPNQFAGARGVE